MLRGTAARTGIALLMRQRGPIRPRSRQHPRSARAKPSRSSTSGDIAAERCPTPRRCQARRRRTLLIVPLLKDDELIGASPSIARRCGRSPTSRSSWSTILPLRPSSPSRTPACSTSCASAPTIFRGAGAADRDLGGVERHLQLARRTGAGFQGNVGERGTYLRGQVRCAVSYEEGRFAIGRAARCTACLCRISRGVIRGYPYRPRQLTRSRWRDKASRPKSPT